MLVLGLTSLILPWSHLTIEALVHIGEHLLSIFIRGPLAKSNEDGGNYNHHDGHKSWSWL